MNYQESLLLLWKHPPVVKEQANWEQWMDDITFSVLIDLQYAILSPFFDNLWIFLHALNLHWFPLTLKNTASTQFRQSCSF
jgi:nitroreductase